MHRGARRAPIFVRDADCVLLLDTLGDVVDRFGLEVHAYSLMPNHYHLLVCTPAGNLSRAMRHLNGVYTQRLNRLHDWDGPVFRGRFKSQLVTEEAYRRELVAYIHLNPVRAGLVRRADESGWTSHRAHLGLDKPPPWLSLGGVFEAIGAPSQLQDFVRSKQVGKQPWPDDMDVQTGWRNAPSSSPPTREGQRGDTALDIERLLEILAAVVEADVSELLVAKQGRSAAPARRFAALKLAGQSHLSHRDVAKALNMSVQQVSNVRYRATKVEPSALFIRWESDWTERLESEK
jgi:REP element-mobilizing transposase RayT